MIRTFLGLTATAVAFSFAAACSVGSPLIGPGDDAASASSSGGPEGGSGSSSGGGSDASTVSDVGSSSDAGSALSIVLTPGTVVGNIDPQFFGINYVAVKGAPVNEDWPGSGSNKGIAQTRISTLRYPGGDGSERFDWRCPYYDPSATGSAICPATPTAMSTSVTSPDVDLWSYIAPFKNAQTVVLYQTDVFGTSGYTYNGQPFDLPIPPGQTTTVDSPQAVAAWAQHNLTAGIASYWEIGNEPDLILDTSNAGLPFTTYTNKFIAQATAIHGVDPTAMVYGPVTTQYTFPTATTDGKVGEFLSELTASKSLSLLYGVSIHYYSGDCMDAAATWQNLIALPGAWASTHMAWTQRVLGEYSFTGPIIVSEYSLGPQGCLAGIWS